MAVTKVNARAWIFEYFDGVATYTQIGGLKSFAIGRTETRTDTTSFASAGAEEGEILARGMTLKLEGFYLLDTGAGTQDAGQALMETAGEALGAASVVQVRITRPDNKKKVVSFTVHKEDQGGGNNDKTTWGVVCTRTGAEPAFA